MAKTKLLNIEEMNAVQELVYELLPVGDSDNNLTRARLVEILGTKDSNVRAIVKSLLPYAPVVASKGYFIASNEDELIKYINAIKEKIKGLQRTQSYLQLHLNKMVTEDEF